MADSIITLELPERDPKAFTSLSDFVARIKDLADLRTRTKRITQIIRERIEFYERLLQSNGACYEAYVAQGFSEEFLAQLKTDLDLVTSKLAKYRNDAQRVEEFMTFVLDAEVETRHIWLKFLGREESKEVTVS